MGTQSGSDPDKYVPLTVYSEDGERKIIGRAKIVDGGKVVAEFNEDGAGFQKFISRGTLGSMSLGFELPKPQQEIPERIMEQRTGKAILSVIYDWFTSHKPNGIQTELYRKCRSHGSAFASWVVLNCPDNDERRIALEKIREAVMWANNSISLQEDSIEVESEKESANPFTEPRTTE